MGKQKTVREPILWTENADRILKLFIVIREKIITVNSIGWSRISIALVKGEDPAPVAEEIARRLANRPVGETERIVREYYAELLEGATPVPYRSGHGFTIVTKRGESFVANCNYGYSLDRLSRQNRDFIIKACNEHQLLRDQLLSCVQYLPEGKKEQIRDLLSGGAK